MLAKIEAHKVAIQFSDFQAFWAQFARSDFGSLDKVGVREVRLTCGRWGASCVDSRRHQR